MGPDSIVVQAPVLQRRTLTGHVVRRPEPDSVAVLLPGSASAIWELLIEPIAVGDLVASLARAHDEDPRRVHADVVSTLDQLIEQGLVHCGDD